MVATDFDRGRSLEGRATGEEVEGDAAEPVEIDAVVDVRGVGDRLRREVERRSRDRVRVGERRTALGLEVFHESEIDELDRIGGPTALAEENVGRLHVTMNESERVRFGE